MIGAHTSRAGLVAVESPDITRLTHDTGFAPAFDIAKAVADHVAWRAENPH